MEKLITAPPRRFRIPGLLVASFFTLFGLATLVSPALATDAGVRPAAISFKAQSFDLADVKLLSGPFRETEERNRDYLLSLESDRFLHYFRTEAGLAPKAAPYGGWESPTTGAGRCLGHYLSALALQYRATGDARFNERLTYLVGELALCQQHNGGGYLSAQAGLKEVFAALAKGDPGPLIKARVPWYIQHKLWAGLRDAHQLAGNEQAKDVLVRLADWAVEVTGNLSDAQFQTMLQREFGGIQETLADVYAITGEQKYLALARRFYHQKPQDPLAAREDKLNGLHANTLVPKLVAAAALYELTAADRDRVMAEYFWNEVVHHHSYVMGGNSENEHFGEPDKLATRLGNTTAETCNTYNMLKLTRHLFTWEPKVEYTDYYERALYNHILASQEPKQGMFTYFVPLKAGHFKTWSTPQDSFWCCVGTGMENHAKYGDSIYFHDAGSLYVNLFIPSELTWKEKGLVVRQETRYPETGAVMLTLSCAQPVKLALKLRYPAWSQPGLVCKVNDKVVAVESKPGGYVTVEREWKNGDRVEVDIPLRLRTEATPDNPNKLAILYGPLVLGGQLGGDDLKAPLPYARGQTDYANTPDPEAPVLVTDNRPVEQWLKPVAGRPLTFRTEGAGRPGEVTLVPFYRQYYERYVVYWDVFTRQNWAARQAVYEAEQARRRALEARLIDELHPGEQQSETDHHLQGEKTDSGMGSSGKKWRHAVGGWFAFEMKVLPGAPMELACTYWGSDGGNRIFQILVDGTPVAAVALKKESPGKLIEKVYAIPAALTQGRQSVTVRFQARPENVAGGLFSCQTLRQE